MASMDAKFHQALLEASSLRTLVRQAQNKSLISYHEEAKSIFYKEIYIAIFLFFLIGLMIYFGKKIKRSLDSLLADLELQNNNLSDSEKKLKSVLNNVLEAIILINDQGIIEYTNPQTEKIFQRASEELQGKNVKILMPEPYHSHHDEYIQKYLDTGEAKIIGVGREVQGLKKDGTIFPLSLAVSKLKLKEKTLFVGVLKDITEKKKSEFYLSSISDIQEKYINNVGQENLFNSILKFLLDYTESEYGFIGAILRDSNNTAYLKTYAITNIAWNEQTKEFYKKNAPEGLEFKNLNTLFGYTIKTGEIVLSNDPKNDPRAGGLPEGHPPMHCYLGMPIKGNSGLIAMYGIANRKGGYNQALVSELSAITTVMTSIVEASQNASLIEKMANHDPLTGAHNRFYFKSRINEVLNERKKQKNPKSFCLMMVDLNKFKHINDYYGHEYGDYVLKTFSKRIKDIIKQQDLLTRIGGDEFTILIENMRNVVNAGKIAERIISASKDPYIMNNKKLECDASVGIACFPSSGNDVDTLLGHADLALYQAKSLKDGYSYFSNKLQVEYLNRKNLEHEIIQAFEKKEFYLVFQPIVEIKSKKNKSLRSINPLESPKTRRVFASSLYWTH